MSVSVSHQFVSLIPDGPDTTQVRPSDWNAGHTVTGLGTAAEANLGTGASDAAYGNHTHTGVYAPVANGVTNGDSHDHSGGDGAQIDHGGLGGLADDDHTQYANGAGTVTSGAIARFSDTTGRNFSQDTKTYPYILAQAAIPMILCSSGTMGNNGALSGLTALPTTYSGGAYIRLPANAISAGSAAGLYYFVASSTTAGTVYNNTYTSGIPTIPASPTAFATTGPGAFTQTTASDITLQTITVPGGSMGANGALRNDVWVAHANSAGNKTIKINLGVTAFFSHAVTTSATTHVNHSVIRNRGVQNSQYMLSAANSAVLFGGSSSSSSATTSNAAIDTSTDKNLTLTGQLAVATDYIVLEGYTIEVLPG